MFKKEKQDEKSRPNIVTMDVSEGFIKDWVNCQVCKGDCQWKYIQCKATGGKHAKRSVSAEKD